VTGSSTAKGFEKLISGLCDLAMMTRPITEAENKAASEKDVSVVHKMFGYIGLAIITNVRNPVKEMTMEQVNKVFTGKITNWAELGGPNEVIKVLTRPVPAIGSGVLVQEKILNNQPYAEGHQVMSSWQSMVKVCSRSLAIGYMPTTSVYFGNMDKEGIRIIRLRKDEKSPPIPLEAGMSKETSYPVAVPFYLYWNSKTQNSCILNFVEHIAVKAQ
jgi:ABC-type phosphate transport system substrate-binding protein